jgi:nucleotidyltransferase/DNA polymerase involved in DNA repair
MSSATVPLNAIEGIDPVHSTKLKNAGIETVERLAECSADDIATMLDVSLDDANTLADFARQIIKVKSEQKGFTEALPHLPVLEQTTAATASSTSSSNTAESSTTLITQSLPEETEVLETIRPKDNNMDVETN